MDFFLLFSLGSLNADEILAPSFGRAWRTLSQSLLPDRDFSEVREEVRVAACSDVWGEAVS